MIKLFFLVIFFLMGSQRFLPAQTLEKDLDFMKEVDSVKNPFEDGLPKPVVVISRPSRQERPRIKVFSRPRPTVAVQPVIALPQLQAQGVIVGGDVHQAIINDQVVPLGGAIKGARVVSVTKQGVGLLFKGKKLFLKIE